MAIDMNTDGRNTRLCTYNAISPAVEECFPVHRKTSPIVAHCIIWHRLMESHSQKRKPNWQLS